MSQAPPPPPQFDLPQQRDIRRTNRTLWIVAACIAIPCCGILIAAGFFGWKLFTESMPFLGCVAASESVSLSLGDYAKEHDGKLPKAETWQTDLRKYYDRAATTSKSSEFFDSRMEGQWGCKGKDGSVITGFMFNDKYSGKPVPQVTDASTEPVIFEVERAGDNLHGSYRLREHTASPKIVMGEHRGWLEIWPGGNVQILINKGGRAVRSPIDLNDQSNFEIDARHGVEVPAPRPASEPSKG